MTMVMTGRRCVTLLSVLAALGGMACQGDPVVDRSVQVEAPPPAAEPAPVPAAEPAPVPAAEPAPVPAPKAATPAAPAVPPRVAPTAGEAPVGTPEGTARYALVHTANLVGELEPCG